MSPEELQHWTAQISMAAFKRPFLHRITFNHRLKACGGRYFPKTGHIDISYRHFVAYGREEVEGIIKHELCHYHLHQQGLPFGHRDSIFKQLLNEVNASRYCRALPNGFMKRKKKKKPTIEERMQPGKYRYQIICNGCARTAFRQRRTEIGKYKCGKCHSTLRMIDLRMVSQNVQE